MKLKVLFLTAVLTSIAFARSVEYQLYECTLANCDLTLRVKEDSAHIHKCSGTSDKPHRSEVMKHTGSETVEVK